MGLTISNKQEDFYIGYLGYAQLRAELLNEVSDIAGDAFNEHLASFTSSLTEVRRRSEIIKQNITHPIWLFVKHDDTSGVFFPETCKKISAAFEGIFLTVYKEEFETIKRIFKYAAENNSTVMYS